jgi:hypothetical protein
MIPLTFSVAILDKLTRRTCLETENPLHLLLAAISAAVAHLAKIKVHDRRGVGGQIGGCCIHTGDSGIIVVVDGGCAALSTW